MYNRGYRQPYMQQPPSSHGNLTYTESIPEQYGLPVDTMLQTAGILYERGEQNRLAFEELRTAAELDKEKIRKGLDDGIIDESINRIGESMQEFIDGKNFHDPTAASTLMTSYRKYLSDPMRNKAIQERAKIDQYEELLSSDENTPERFKQLARRVSYSSSNNTPISKDEDGNIIGGFNPYILPEYIDGKDLIKEYLDNWSSYKDSIDIIDSSSGTGVWDMRTLGQHPYLSKFTQTLSGLSSEKVEYGISQLLLNDDKFMDWVEAEYYITNYNSESGDLNPVNQNRLALQFAPTKANSDGTVKSPEEIFNDGKNALSGEITKRIRLHSIVTEGESLSEEEALRQLDNEVFIKNKIEGYIAGIGTKFTHTIQKANHSINRDALYFHYLDKAVSSNFYSYTRGAVPIEEYSVREGIKQMQSDITNLKDLNTKIEQVSKNNPQEDISDIIQSRDILEAELKFKELKYNMSRDEANAFKGAIAMPGNVLGSSMIQAFVDMLAGKKEKQYRDIQMIVPDDGDAKFFLDNLNKNLSNGSMNWINAVDGMSSTHKDIQKVIQNSESVEATYVVQPSNGNLQLLITYAMKDGSDKHYIAESPELMGIGKGLAREMINMPNNDRFRFHPEYTHAIADLGKYSAIGNSPVYTYNKAPLNTTLGKISSDALNWKVGTTNKDNPIKLNAGLTNAEIDIYFERLERGFNVYIFDPEINDFTTLRKYLKLDKKYYPTIEHSFEDLYEASLNIKE